MLQCKFFECVGLTLLGLLCGMIPAMGQDSASFKTLSGREFKDASVTKVDGDTVTVSFSGGIVRLPADDIPVDVRRKLGIPVSALLDTEANTLEALRAIFETEYDAGNAPMVEFETTYLTHLENLHKEMMKKGELDLLLLVEQEKESFRTVESPNYDDFPQLKKLREIYEATLPKIHALVAEGQSKTMGLYINRLDEWTRYYTQQGQLDVAKGFSEEEKRILAIIEEANRVEEPPTPKSEIELLAHWKLDGDAKDSSGNGHDGRVVGGEFVKGRVGSGAFKSGLDQYIKIRHDNSLNLQHPFSISAWYQLDESASHLTWAPIICKASTTWRLQTGSDGKFVALHLNNFGDKIHCNSPESAVLKGVWQHVAAVFDGEFITLYVDGKLVAREGREGYVINHGNDADIRIGHNSQDDRLYFQGAIDDVRIYKGTLTAEQVETLALAGGE